jgi:putative tryptophan/tyrosine transport system substrate-binding protein
MIQRSRAYEGRGHDATVKTLPERIRGRASRRSRASCFGFGLEAAALMVIFVVGLLMAPRLAEAQQTGKVWRIGVLMSLYSPDADVPQALRDGLRTLGYTEGQNLVMEWRYAQGQDDRLPALAAELVRLNVDVIVTDITLTTRAAMRATSTIPIVMGISADAVGGRLVSNLARPGGNVTGNSVLLAETSVKRLQLLKEALPKVTRVAVLWDPATPFHKAMLSEIAAAAASLRVEPLAIAVKTRADLGDALAEITKQRADALFVSQGMSPVARRQLLAFAAKKRLPSMFMIRDYVTAGGLMSYAPNYAEMFRHAAVYVDKILKGTKPGDLPIEQPTRFDLVVNMKTATALGLTISPSVLARADEVIQ